MIDLTKTIKAINVDAKFIIQDEDIDNIQWINTTPISKSDIQAKQTELQTEYDTKEYQRNRAKEYPAIGDQLDMLWHSIDEDAALKSKYFKFHQAILAVKSKYPK